MVNGKVTLAVKTKRHNGLFYSWGNSAVSNDYAEGDAVKWKWGKGYGHGQVKSRFEEKVSRTIDGTEVVREGSKEDPAYYVEVDDGNNVLKLGSELEAD